MPPLFVVLNEAFCVIQHEWLGRDASTSIRTRPVCKLNLYWWRHMSRVKFFLKISKKLHTNDIQLWDTPELISHAPGNLQGWSLRMSSTGIRTIWSVDFSVSARKISVFPIFFARMLSCAQQTISSSNPSPPHSSQVTTTNNNCSFLKCWHGTQIQVQYNIIHT